MKKAIIALAVAAGSIAAAQAADTTTLYGTIQFSSNIISDAKLKNVTDSVKDHHWALQRERTRIGLKGSEDLGNGLQATFKIEGNDGLGAGREAYLGLKGGFGEVRLGRQGSTWNVDDGYFRTSNPAFGLDDVALTPATGSVIDPTSRKDNTIKYISPDFSGLTFAGRVQATRGGLEDNSKGVDAWDASVAYEANGFKASAAYAVQYDGVNRVAAFKDNVEALGAQVGYENDQFGVVGNVQHLSHSGMVYNLQGQYKFDDKSSARAGFGYADPDGANNNLYKVGLGYQYNLSKRTSTWVEGIYQDGDKRDGTFSASVGIRHDF